MYIMTYQIFWRVIRVVDVLWHLYQRVPGLYQDGLSANTVASCLLHQNKGSGMLLLTMVWWRLGWM